MATQSLPQSAETPQTYTIKEFQLLVRDKPAIPAEIQPFVGAPFTCSVEIFRRFQGLATCPVETFLALHLDGKNRLVGMTTCSIGSMTASLAHPAGYLQTCYRQPDRGPDLRAQPPQWGPGALSG